MSLVERDQLKPALRLFRGPRLPPPPPPPPPMRIPCAGAAPKLWISRMLTESELLSAEVT